MEEIGQPSFRVITESAAWPPAKGPRRRGKRRRRWVTPELVEFERRAVQAGRSPTTAATQMRSVRSMLKVASRQRGYAVGVRELFLNPDRLAAAACDAVPLGGRGNEQLTYATLASRRIAVRSFMRLMEDLLGRDAQSLIAEFESALVAHSDRVGQVYLPKAGRPTGRKTHTPMLADIEALLRELARPRDAYFAERDVAFVSLLASTALRLSSAVGIDGEDFHRLSSGLWVAVWEKCKSERVQVRIPAEVEAALVRYVAAFNGYSAKRGSSERIGFGTPGPFWRQPPARPWSAQGAEKAIRGASGRACSRAFGPHAIRRFVAQELAESMSRAGVAEALRWDGVTTLDKHYAPPPGSSGLPEAPRPARLVEGRSEHAAASKTA